MSRYAFALLTLVLLLFSIGLMMIFNTSSAEVLDRFLDRSTHYALVKQILYAFLGLVLGLGVFWIGYKDLIRASSVLLIICTVLLLLVFIPGIGQQVNGAYRWIKLGSGSFQPSEFAKFFILLYFIKVISSKSCPLNLKEFLTTLGKVAVPMGLILVEPDNGTVAIIGTCLLTLFLLSAQKFNYWALPFFILMGLGVIVASQMPHVSDRIQIYLHPEYDLKGKGHQPYQAKIAAGSGGLFGKGIGESLQKLEYLPEARNDYIAAIFAEEMGFVGMTLMILSYMGIGFCGFVIAQKAVDKEGFYTASILTFLICFQAFLNLGVVSGLLPSKGTNLPFFSQGGSSLVAHAMILCTLLNIAIIPKKRAS
ncbi:MAG: Stage sporulation protein [Chlamydiota bacterium]|jgi:cell division protein FtsW